MAAPCAAIQLWREAGTVDWRLNPAALHWSESRALEESDWIALAQRLGDALPKTLQGAQAIAGQPLRWNAVELAAGWICWLSFHPLDGAPPSATMPTAALDDVAASRVRARASIDVDFEEALELASISVWRIDLATRRIYYNAAGYRLTGVPFQPDGMTLDEVRALTHPDDLVAMVQAAEAAVAHPGVIDVEGRYRNPDGTYRHLLTRRVAQRNARGEVVALMGISLDQSEQIAERERAQSRREREAFLLASHLGLDGVAFGDVEDDAQQ